MTDVAEDDYRHPKCYANTRGGCCTKISGEHYVSLGLIRLYSDEDPEFTLRHKTGKGIGHEELSIPVDRLVSGDLRSS